MGVRAITGRPRRTDARAAESRAQAPAVEAAVDVRTVPRGGGQACFTRRMKGGTSSSAAPRRPPAPAPPLLAGDRVDGHRQRHGGRGRHHADTVAPRDRHARGPLAVQPRVVVAQVDRRLPRAARNHGRAPGRSKPVAITVSFTWPSSLGSMTAPKMMLASSWAASWMIVEASWTSTSDRSEPP